MTTTNPLERMSALVAAMTAAIDTGHAPYIARSWRDRLTEALAEQVRVDAQLHQQIIALREMIDIRDESDERPIADLLGE